eukprot:2385531-Alexandrium_andersonii.AAC.1
MGTNLLAHERHAPARGAPVVARAPVLSARRAVMARCGAGALSSWARACVLPGARRARGGAAGARTWTRGWLCRSGARVG